MLVSWPAPFIFWTKVKDHEKIKTELKEKILKESEDFKYYNSPLKERQPGENKWQCEVLTGYFHRKEIKYLFTDKIINSVIESPLDELFENKNIFKEKPRETVLSEIWFNVYKPGYSQEIHAHHGASISGIYLLELNEPNNTVFFSNTPTYKYNERDWVGGVFPTEHIEEGNIILFPSELSHCVKKCSNYRITVAFNLIFNY